MSYEHLLGKNNENIFVVEKLLGYKCNFYSWYFNAKQKHTCTNIESYFTCPQGVVSSTVSFSKSARNKANKTNQWKEISFWFEKIS